jgi:hypothetical protein
MEYFLIGFFPKKRVTRSNWQTLHEDVNRRFPAPVPVEQLCSVSNCIVKGIKVFDYQEISMASFNQYGGFNQIKTSLEISAKDGNSEFDIYAYALPEFIFQDGQLQPHEIGCVDPDEIPEDSQDFSKIGYDVVEINYCSFHCSPLTCNWQANRYEDMLNEYCLVENEADAITVAISFSIDKPEPGPYIIVEIWKYVGTQLGESHP